MDILLNKLGLNRQFFYFVLACGTAATANIGSRIIFGHFMAYSFSVVCAFLVGISTAFILCKTFIFSSTQNNLGQQLLYFCLVNAVGMLLTLGTSLGLYYYCLTFIPDQFLRKELAHFVGVMSPAILSYFGHKYFSFR